MITAGGGEHDSLQNKPVCFVLVFFRMWKLTSNSDILSTIKDFHIHPTFPTILKLVGIMHSREIPKIHVL